MRERILEIGYDSSRKGFDGASCGVNIAIGAQSPDIAQGVDEAYEARVEGDEDPLDKQGAGDQGLMFGGGGKHRGRSPVRRAMAGRGKRGHSKAEVSWTANLGSGSHVQYPKVRPDLAATA